MVAELIIPGRCGKDETLIISKGRAAFADYEGEVYVDWSYKANPRKWKIMKRLIKELKK